jgi:wyosine [tRNA(Phe)-imidazoG37] synthetase (radical SAM superfamily)
MAAGNIVRSSPEQVWNSKTYQIVRKDILAGRMPALCAEADGCPFHHTENHPSYYQFDPKKGPGFIDIQLPNFFCNIGGYRPSEKTPACIMCERNTPGYRFQDAKNFDFVLKQISTLMPQVYAIHVQGVAEPFWKDAIFDVLDKINYDSYKNQVHVNTVSNGTVFTADRQKRFLDRCPSTSVSISVDAATSDTYRKIRRLNIWDTLVKNLRHYGELRKSYPKTHFRIQNNINLLNIKEIKAMVQMASEVGVDSLELNPTGGNPKEYIVNPSNAHLFRLAEEEARQEAQRLGLTLEILRPLDLGLVEKSLN